MAANTAHIEHGIESTGKDDFKSEFFDDVSGVGNVASHRMFSQANQRGYSFHASELEGGDPAHDFDIEEIASMLGIEKSNFKRVEKIFTGHQDEVK